MGGLCYLARCRRGDSPTALAEEDPDDDEDDNDGTEIHLFLLSSWCSLLDFSAVLR